jgi:putative transposase
MQTVVLTYRFRIKGGSSNRRLSLLAPAANLVWNYDHLTKGVGKELGLHFQTVQAISKEFVTRRKQFKKSKLRWRISHGSKRSLGWIPFKAVAVKVAKNKVTYAGQEYKFWKSRELPGKIKTGSFSEDARGHWYVNFVVEAPAVATKHAVEEVAVDLGLKDTAILSDGTRIENLRTFAKYEAKLANFQRHGKKKQAKRLATRIKNIRKDFIHKKTLELVRKYKTIFVGDVSGKFLQSTNGKSSQDASTGLFRQILSYKAIRHQGVVVDVSEFASTVTCSNCFSRSGPRGLSALGVREWACPCGMHHDRDVNAALNILRVGRDSLRAAKAA